MTMAGYSIDTGINPDEQAEEPQKRRKREPILPQEPDFIQALCTIYAQKEKELSFRLQRTGLHVRGAKTAPLPLFCVSPDYEPPATVKGILRADLHLPGGTRAKNLDITKRSVQFDFTTLESAQDRMHTAFAMAMAAMANKDLRKSGVRINGNEEEQLYLLIAARKVGLKVADVDPKLEEQATKYLKGNIKLARTTKVSALWSDFLAHKPAPAAAAPAAADEEKTAAPQPAPVETKPEQPAADSDDELDIPDFLKAYLAELNANLAEQAAGNAKEAAAEPVAEKPVEAKPVVAATPAEPVITPPPAQEQPPETLTGELLPVEEPEPEAEEELPVIEGEIVKPQETAAPQSPAAEETAAADDDFARDLPDLKEILTRDTARNEDEIAAAPQPSVAETKPEETIADDDGEYWKKIDAYLNEIDAYLNDPKAEEAAAQLAAALTAAEKDLAKMAGTTTPPAQTTTAPETVPDFLAQQWEGSATQDSKGRREEHAGEELSPALRGTLLAETDRAQTAAGKIPLRAPDLTTIWNKKSGPEQVAFLKEHDLVGVLVEAVREGIHPDLAKIVAREFCRDYPDITHEELSELWNGLSNEIKQDVLDESGLTYIGENGRARHMGKVEEFYAQEQQAVQKILDDSGAAGRSFDQLFEDRQIKIHTPRLKLAPRI